MTAPSVTAVARRSATALIISGVLAVIFGLIAAFWPIETTLTLVIMWGVYALIDGVSALVMAFRPEGKSARLWLIFTGIIGILAGLFAMFRPVSSGVALAWVLGIWLIVRGIIEFAGAFAETVTRPRWLLVLGGVLWVIAGILFAANPGAGLLTIALWLGVLAIVWGVMLVGAGIALRSQPNQPEDAQA